MSITESDVRLRASVRMTDNTDGGGRMSTVVIVDGVDNNCFDDITDYQRLVGFTSVRKVFGCALNADTVAYLDAHVVLDVPPADAGTTAFIFTSGSYTTERASAVAAFSAGHSIGFPPSVPGIVYTEDYFLSNGVSTAGSATVTGLTPGTVVAAQGPDGKLYHIEATVGGSVVGCVRRAVSHSGTVGVGAGYSVVLDAPLPFAATDCIFRLILISVTGPRAYGSSLSAAGAASGSASIAVDSVFTQVVPCSDGNTYPTSSALGIDPSNFKYLHGKAPILLPTDKVLISSTVPMSPTAVSNGSTVTTGRTNLQRLRVIGANGTVHARFTAGQPAPTGVGCSADLTAGTVTFSDVSGLSNPVTVEHRIEEMALVDGIAANTVRLNRGLSRAYPAGTRVSGILSLGTLQARATLAFMQAAWTPGQFADTIVGTAPAGSYDTAAHPIEMINQGGITERWVLFFTSTTNFRVIGETVGEVGTGSINADCAITNLATGAPYFTLRQAGWGSGFGASNVLRINTVGANAPVWVGRCVAPSTPGGDDSVTLQLRGYTNT